MSAAVGEGAHEISECCRFAELYFQSGKVTTAQTRSWPRTPAGQHKALCRGRKRRRRRLQNPVSQSPSPGRAMPAVCCCNGPDMLRTSPAVPLRQTPPALALKRTARWCPGQVDGAGR